jgi:hypothetical protein
MNLLLIDQELLSASLCIKEIEGIFNDVNGIIEVVLDG